MSKVKTRNEIRQEIVSHLLGMVRYWAHVLPNQTVEERVQGAIFSTLVMLDGESSLPGFLVVPAPHANDKAYCKEHGENWYPPVPAGIENTVCDVAGGLHSLFISEYQKEKGRIIVRKSTFPQTLYVTRDSDDDDDVCYNADGDCTGFEDGDEVAVYELKTVRRLKVNRELVD